MTTQDQNKPDYNKRKDVLFQLGGEGTAVTQKTQYTYHGECSYILVHKFRLWMSTPDLVPANVFPKT
jgi:hypothetical protein